MVSGAWAFLPWPWRSEEEPQSCDLLRQWLGTCPTGNTGSTDNGRCVLPPDQAIDHGNDFPSLPRKHRER